MIQPEAVLVDVFVFHLARRQMAQAIRLGKMRQHLWLYPAKVTHNIRWTHVQARHSSIIVQGFNRVSFCDIKAPRQALAFHFRAQALDFLGRIRQVLRRPSLHPHAGRVLPPPLVKQRLLDPQFRGHLSGRPITLQGQINGMPLEVLVIPEFGSRKRRGVTVPYAHPQTRYS